VRSDSSHAPRTTASHHGSVDCRVYGVVQVLGRDKRRQGGPSVTQRTLPPSQCRPQQRRRYTLPTHQALLLLSTRPYVAMVVVVVLFIVL